MDNNIIVSTYFLSIKSHKELIHQSGGDPWFLGHDVSGLDTQQ